jgi:hypothetical protein
VTIAAHSFACGPLDTLRATSVWRFLARINTRETRFYLGRFLVLIGFALMSDCPFFGRDQNQGWVLWRFSHIAVGFFFFVICRAKNVAKADDWLNYSANNSRNIAASVPPSLFPRLTPYKDPFTPETRRWSRELFFGGTDNFTGNRELPTTLVTFVLIALFFARLLTLQS